MMTLAKFIIILIADEDSILLLMMMMLARVKVSMLTFKSLLIPV